METYRERLAVQTHQEKQARKEAKRAAELQAAKDTAQALNWPQLVGSEKQIKWALTIRYQWLAKSVSTKAKVRDLCAVLPQNQLEAAINLLAKEAKASEWIRLSGAYGNLKTYLATKLASDSRFVFELMFEDQSKADMQKYTAPPTALKGYAVVLDVEYPIVIPAGERPRFAEASEQELWLESQQLKGSYTVERVSDMHVPLHKMAADAKEKFTFKNEEDAVMFKLRWHNP